MRLTLERRYFKPTYTIGTLYIDGVRFCDTLELPWRGNARRVSCIPEGEYTLEMRRSPKFGRVLPELLHVPSRDAILIHRGNYPRDTQGCILLGENTKVGQVRNSTPYEVQLCKALQQDEQDGETNVIRIRKAGGVR